MIAIRVCPTCKRKFEARVGEPQTYCEECLELKTMSESSVCSWFFDDDDFDDDFELLFLKFHVYRNICFNICIIRQTCPIVNTFVINS